VKPVAGDLEASLQPPEARKPGSIEGKSVERMVSWAFSCIFWKLKEDIKRIGL